MMSRPFLFLPFAALVGVSGYLGWQMGKPLTETDVIDFYAAEWVRNGPDNAALTDCLAMAGREPGVWLVVTCQRGEDVRQIEVDHNGRALAPRAAPQA